MRRKLCIVCAVVCSHVGLSADAQGPPLGYQVNYPVAQSILRRLPVEQITSLPESQSAPPLATITGASVALPATTEVRAPVRIVPTPLPTPAIELEQTETVEIVQPAPQVRVLPVADRTAPDVPLIQRQIEQHFQRAISLGDRGAIYSSRAEFLQGLHLICQALDAHENTNQHDVALHNGLTALQEADDFVAHHNAHVAAINVPHLVTSHRTPVYHDFDVSRVTPIEAYQAYYEYAQAQLVVGCGNEPLASQALFGIGKLHAVLAEKNESTRREHDPKAIVLFQSALAVDASNHQAANEVGVLLARYGKLAEAKVALTQAVQQNPSREAWHNLAIVHQRLGERHEASQAAAWRDATPSLGNASGGVHNVQWVAPAEFNQTAETDFTMVPAAIAPAPMHPTAAATPRQATAADPWWSRLRGVF